MEKEGRFNFKLLVPPRVNSSQVFADKPQENVDNGSELGPSKYFFKDQNMPSIFTKSVVNLTKSTTQDGLKMTVSSTEKEERDCTPGQLCSKMFDEVEKIKCWKVKVACDAAQSERKLQENKKTIETQRNAIQDLQFQNESLSVKLEEQLSENEDLRNKHNATRNLCNLLKETFDRAADKMQLFESEREETHHLLMENGVNVQKMIVAFEELRGQAEDDQKAMETVKEGLQKFEELKEKYQQEYTLKENEVATLQAKVVDKEGELEKVQRDLHDTQNQCTLLQEATTKQHEDLNCLKMEQESLLEKLHSAEQCYKQSETSLEAVIAELKQSREEHVLILSSKDLSLQEVHRVKNEQAEKLEQVQIILVELKNSLAFEEQRYKKCEEKLTEKNQELERTHKLLGEIEEQCAGKEKQITLLQSDLKKNTNSTDLLKGQVDVLEVTVKDLQVKLSAKTIQAQQAMGQAETTRADNEKLKGAAEKAEEVFREKQRITESKVLELEEKLFNEMKKTEEYSSEIVKLNTELAQNQVKYEELLSKCNEVECEKQSFEQQFESKSSKIETIKEKMKVSEEKIVTLSKEIQALTEENQCLRIEVSTMQSLTQGQCQEIEKLLKKMEDKYEDLQEKVKQAERQLKAAEAKCSSVKNKIGCYRKAGEYQKEVKTLKIQIEKELGRNIQLEKKMTSLNEESRIMKIKLEEKIQKLHEEFQAKSSLADELDNEIKELRLTTAEAVKSKEDAELNCEHKTADVVALMEKHKSQYDLAVKEKDAELDERKKSETEALGSRKSLELEVTNLKAENSQLKQQLLTEKDNFQKELSDVKKELSSFKTDQLSQQRNKLESAVNTNEKGRASKKYVFDFDHTKDTFQKELSDVKKELSSLKSSLSSQETNKTVSAINTNNKGRHTDTPKTRAAKMNVFDFVKELDFESSSPSSKRTQKNKLKDLRLEDFATPTSRTKRAGKADKIQSFRIRTPPVAEKQDRWGKRPMESFETTSATHRSIPSFKSNRFKKSPSSIKPPANSKFAAMKRIRDAGWTATVDTDKKRKKTRDIFA
ncbi:synaptonemal complex protein 1 isoform X2 [Corythoichthys intestinalis]|uniref:synaptonemal complex protein 1 isoform X2 n=1 Tax=Corythoichthys intestinalis TaxID=161448 RepID=UPI0025A4F9F2|nr:synaptonemal complex protein 1 isoform X2 [Corythoichthys intestinalis]